LVTGAIDAGIDEIDRLAGFIHEVLARRAAGFVFLMPDEVAFAVLPGLWAGERGGGA
jgi:hypothetical protein